MNKKTILITGCSSGFGREMVRIFLENNWRVIAGFRNYEPCSQAFEREIAPYGAECIPIALDLNDCDQIEYAVERLSSNGNGLDCLINNAGYALTGALEDLEESQIREQMETNFFGPLFLTRRLLPLLYQSKGRVISISSLFGFTGFPLSSVYCASKFAMEGLFESLYYELVPHGIQITIVEPGGYRTRFNENMKWGKTSFDTGSHYYDQTNAYIEMQKKLIQRKPKPIRKFAEAIYKLAIRQKMPLRCQMDRESRLSFILKRILPSALFQNIWLKVAGPIAGDKYATA